jgi:hypothetical protein
MQLPIQTPVLVTATRDNIYIYIKEAVANYFYTAIVVQIWACLSIYTSSSCNNPRSSGIISKRNDTGEF